MTKFEQSHVYTYHLQPTLWKRFIDIYIYSYIYVTGAKIGLRKRQRGLHAFIVFGVLAQMPADA